VAAWRHHPAVHRLLDAVGASAAPAPGSGREILSYLRTGTGWWTPSWAGCGAVCDLIVDQAAKGDPFFQRHLAEGHLDGYGRDLEFIRSLREPLQEALEAAR
jgi:hypothetical protein